MEEKLISFETAKLAKEKRFFIHTKYYYDSDNPLSSSINLKKRNYTIEGFEGMPYSDIDTESGLLTYQIHTINNAPTQPLLQKWLRDIHKIHIVIHRSFSMDNSYHYCIIVDGNYDMELLQECIPDRSYEEALEDALFNALKLI